MPYGLKSAYDPFTRLAALLTVLFLRSLGKVGKKPSNENGQGTEGDTAQDLAEALGSNGEVPHSEAKAILECPKGPAANGKEAGGI